MRVYYNEWDKYAAAWLRNLIAAGHLPPGDVDERSITDVRATDLVGYTSCHFFAGIGGWPLALRLAGWPDDRSVWTGSCPCQPFSAAGKGKGEADERHLWPEFRRLIAELSPASIFGEQVASAAGRQWLAGVRADLEGLAYAVGAADLCAAGVGAPHIRQRLFWVADRDGDRRKGIAQPDQQPIESGQQAPRRGDVDGCSVAHGRMGDTYGSDEHARQSARNDYDGCSAERQKGPGRSAIPGAWDDYEWRVDTDGKARRVKPGIPLLGHGIPGRVGRVRGYGNAIVPQIAAEFIAAYLDLEAAR